MWQALRRSCYLLMQAIERGQGGACNILVTQPRRISAVGVATRVAQEREEPVGDVIGYSVRMESRRSAHTRLLFCTTGALVKPPVKFGCRLLIMKSEYLSASS